MISYNLAYLCAFRTGIRGQYILMEKVYPGMKELFLIFSLFFCITACTPQTLIHKEPLKENGEVIVYLQPLPESADRLIFSIDTISLVGDDGTEYSLPVSLHTVRGPKFVKGQKLLGTGIVPQGEYSGISIKLGNAYFKDSGGETALLVPEEPVMVEHGFRVARGEASTLLLTLTSSELLSKDIIFKPLFTLSSQKRELFTLIGFVTNSDANTISVFNKKMMMNVSTISTGKSPAGIVLDQARGRAYIAVSEDDLILAVDAFSGEITDKLKLDLGDEPVFLCLTPDGKVLVSVNNGSNTVSLIDTGAMFESDRIRVGEGPASAVIDPLGLRAYIVNAMSNSISVVDLSTNVIAATIAVEGTPLRAAFNRKGDRLYVANTDIPDLTVIDPSSLSVTGKIFIGTAAQSLKVDTRTGLILVGNRTGGGISIVDPSASMFIDTIKTDGAVAFMTIDDQENTLFALIPEMKLLQKISLTSRKIIAEIDVGEGAYAVVVMGER